MSSQVDALADALSRVITVLQNCGAHAWVTLLGDIRSDLRLAEKQNMALETLSRLFGGMGTLNDIYFCERNGNLPDGRDEKSVNAEFEGLLDELFAAFANVRGFTVARHKELPPRVAYAFRRQAK